MITIHQLTARQATGRLDELALLLVDAVRSGASINFLAGFSDDQARAFWKGQVPGLQAGERLLLVADTGTAIAGSVIVSFAQQPNAPHRAEIGKMLVLSTLPRQGLGRRLLTAAEDAARCAGRTLLLLDTESGSAGDRLYRACGWQEAGRVADHAFRPDGRLAETTIFTKCLGPHRLSA